MTMYCTCGVCAVSPAQPNAIVQGRAEEIPGAQLVMAPGSVLAHWSAVNFNAMETVEILQFVQLGHQFRTGCSFYYYANGVAPANRPQQLALMGLGGANRYLIDAATGNNMTIYQKVPGAPQEVSVVVGCGGNIAFDANRDAIGYNANPGALPILTIP